MSIVPQLEVLPDTDELLRIRNLSVTYAHSTGTIRAVDDISFSIRKRDFVALVGESGCGKSTLALAIMGLLGATARVEGEISYLNKNLLRLDQKSLRRYRGSEIGMIFQESLSALNQIQKIGDQMADVIKLAENRRRLTATRWSSKREVQKLAKSALREEAISWLRKVRIADPDNVADRYPFQLSGGMLQRVSIAMALSQDPSLLLADEPTTALDVTTQAQILQLVRSLIESSRKSILLITHDLGVAAQVANRILVMYGGDIVESGSAVQLFSNPLHPYTQGLLKCYPSSTKRKAKLETLSGSVLLLTRDVIGCRFAARCNRAKDNCVKEKPRNVEAEPGHFVKCTLYY